MKEESAKTSLWVMNELKATINRVSAGYPGPEKQRILQWLQRRIGATISSGIRTVSSHPEVASLEGNQIKALKPGYTDITSYLTTGGKEYASTRSRVYVTDEAPVFTGKRMVQRYFYCRSKQRAFSCRFLFRIRMQTLHLTARRVHWMTRMRRRSTYYKLLTQKEWDFALIENPEKQMQRTQKVIWKKHFRRKQKQISRKNLYRMHGRLIETQIRPLNILMKQSIQTKYLSVGQCTGKYHRV